MPADDVVDTELAMGFDEVNGLSRPFILAAISSDSSN